MHDHQRVESRRNPLECRGEPLIEGGFGTYHQHLYAQQAAMGVRELAGIIQRARGNDHLLDQLRPNAAAPVQDALDRCSADAGMAGDIPIIRLAHFPTSPKPSLNRCATALSIFYASPIRI
ncbi:hypothetical protein RHECNPAF_4310044 [Rhizobium etli CNPAF512]|nr:hypothetical protein RHECNPAF_4310044 [Rhizobium etli CNPAF512]